MESKIYMCDNHHYIDNADKCPVCGTKVINKMAQCCWCGLYVPENKLNMNGECRFCAEHGLEVLEA